MMRVGWMVVMGFALVAGAQTPGDAKPRAEEQQWNALMLKKDVPGAKSLCWGWEANGTAEQKLEGEKCLTAIALQGVSAYTARMAQQGLPRFPTAVADEALGHIGKGLELAPEDMKLNVLRLFVLAGAHRYVGLEAAFEETLKNKPDEEATPYWQQAIGDMVEGGTPRGGLVLAEVLYKHFPESHEAAGNVGAVHDMMGEWNDGLPFLRKAVELAPTDAIDTWNLGSALDHVGKEDEANKWMTASLKLTSEPESLPGRRCLYGEFLVVKRKQTVQGCALIKSSCGLKVQPAGCAVAVRKPGR